MQNTIMPNTALEKRSHCPELVLHELPSGRVTGVAMCEMGSSFHVTFARKYAEPEEVEKGIDLLRRLDKTEVHGTWRKDLNVDAATLDEAIAMSPESTAGQKFVFLYRGNEWLWGIWNNPLHAARSDAANSPVGIDLSSVADFYGTRVSAAKRATRPGLDPVRANQTLVGSYLVLETAIDLVKRNAPRLREKQDYEAHPAVAHLCDWWNRQAPEGSREAGYVRLYVWDGAACDPEEPAAQAHQVSEWPSYALFEHPGMASILACFYRGRHFNRDDGTGYTTIFAADGREVTSIGLDAASVDEAYYSFAGLKNLAEQELFVK